jgi:hypothetical protein
MNPQAAMSSLDKFLVWLRGFNPALYQAAMSQIAKFVPVPRLSGAFADVLSNPATPTPATSSGLDFSSIGNAINSVISTVGSLGNQYLNYQQQQAVLKAQLNNLNANQIAAGYPPATATGAGGAGGMSPTTLLVLGAAAVGAYMFLGGKKTRR